MDTALDHHVTSCTYHQYGLRRPAAPSLVHERPTHHSFRMTFIAWASGVFPVKHAEVPIALRRRARQRFT